MPATPFNPFFGQGANLALEDAITLGHLLDESCRARGESAGHLELALAAYDRIRLPRRTAVADYSHQLGLRYHWANPLKRRVRTLYLQHLGPRLLDAADWIYTDSQPTVAPNNRSTKMTPKMP